MAKRAAAAAPVQDDYVSLAAETMLGDLRDFILDRLRNSHDALPWNMRGEAEQRELVADTERACRHLVEQCCAMIASGGQQAARGGLVKLQAKGTALQMQIDVPASDPLRHALVDRVGGAVMIVLSSPDEYAGQRAPVAINPDQPDMLEAAQ
jgi:hypothetical protein